MRDSLHLLVVTVALVAACTPGPAVGPARGSASRATDGVVPSSPKILTLAINEDPPDRKSVV